MSEFSKRNDGKGLELFMLNLYADLGYLDVTRDYRISKNPGSSHIRGQIDLVYTRALFRRYVECKQRTKNNVTFNDYSKFETTLKTFNIASYLGEMVTNTYFDKKVSVRAAESKIKLIDRDELIVLNARRNSNIQNALTWYRGIALVKSQGLEYLSQYKKLVNMSVDEQIEYYSRI